MQQKMDMKILFHYNRVDPSTNYNAPIIYAAEDGHEDIVSL